MVALINHLLTIASLCLGVVIYFKISMQERGHIFYIFIVTSLKLFIRCHVSRFGKVFPLEWLADHSQPGKWLLLYCLLYMCQTLILVHMHQTSHHLPLTFLAAVVIIQGWLMALWGCTQVSRLSTMTLHWTISTRTWYSFLPTKTCFSVWLLMDHCKWFNFNFTVMLLFAAHLCSSHSHLLLSC